MDTVKHEPTAAARRRAERDPWYRIPTNDRLPSQRLSISITEKLQYARSTWRDGKRITLDARLPEILEELERRPWPSEEARGAKERGEAEARCA